MSGAPRFERVRDLFLRLLGLVYLAAFVSLAVQVRTLIAADGLLPARELLDAVGSGTGADRFHRVPTIFWIAHGERALVAAAWFGALLSLPLVLGRAPLPLRVALWALYLSFVSVGRDFLAFQWDNLLLEAGCTSLFLGKRGRPPSAAGLVLARWLLFRLLFESGVSKLALGDPSWRDGTAMVAYFETAPIPTALGWWAHQLPRAALRASAFLSLFAELVLPLAVWASRRLRLAALALLVPFQLGILLTANYGFFNHLSLALHVFLLEDRDLEAAAARLRRAFRRPDRGAPPAAVDVPSPSRPKRIALGLAVVSIVACSLADFALVLTRSGEAPWERRIESAARALYGLYGPFRSVNSYHLFATMTLTREEVVIEGSDDGREWKPFEMRWKPGDPNRAPPFVAPHQPRVDFQCWFLTLGGGSGYFGRLLERICEKPEAVRGLFDPDPFPEAPPRRIRVGIWRYAFTDRATRARTGAWWRREFVRFAIPDRPCGGRSR